MKAFTRTLAVVLSFIMLFTAIPFSAFAAEYEETMTTASTKLSALAPGVTETEVVAYDKNGARVVYYVVNADIATNPDVLVKANYHDNDNTGNWGKATVVEQANAAKEKRGYNVVATTNASYYNVTTGQPTGAFVMEGVNINGNSTGDSYNFFAIMKDGTAMIGEKGTWSQYADNVQEAVGGWNMLIKDGEICDNLSESKYPRSTVGIKADGNIVLMVADGNQTPYSSGLTYKEQAEVMYNLGCVDAVELDGGGSATYAAKLEGTDHVTLRNTPCDGTIRSVSNSLMVISTAVADGTFDHANLSTDYPYYAPYSNVTINALGADKAGYPVEIPESVTWSLSDESYGSIDNGVFVSNGKIGTVTAQMIISDEIVGQIDISIAHPTEIAFQAEDKMIPYGKPSDFTVDALYNGAELYADASAYEFTCTAGSMTGFVYTAPESGDIKATVTVKYKYDDTLASDTISIEFGKGSDILFDFEAGEEDTKYWGDYFDLVEAAENGDYTNGYTVVYESESSPASNLVSTGIHENVFLATKDNGQVYSGDYALGYTLDYRYSTSHANWQYAYLYFLGDPITLLDTDNGIAGTRLGMWMYIPEEAVGSCARFCYTYEQDNGTLNTAYLYFTYMYVEKGFSKLTSEKIPEAGWAYVYVDMKQISDTYVSTSYYKNENGDLTREATTNYAPGFIQFIISSSATGAEKVTFYIDDITLDYSDAVDDRDMPIISNPLILEDQDSYAIDGRTLDYNTITVTADVTEDTSRGTNYTGLDTETAQVYVDGQKVDTKYAAGKISATGIELPNGTHDITFEIADKQGNYTKLTKQIVIETENEYPSVTLTGNATNVNSDGNMYTGGQYNMSLNTDKVEAIDEVNFKLWLNSASEWALEHMTVLNGFEVTYKLDELACMADITVTRVDSDATGEADLLTIPVYAWSWNEELGLTDASNQWNKNGCAPQIDISYKIKYGHVSYTSDYKVDNTAYVPGFSNKRVDIETELNSSIANLKNSIGEWHYHSSTAIDDVMATCTENGYTGRTICSVCNSILEWGATLEATGHNYTLVDGVLKCVCDDLYNGLWSDGKTYVDGNIIADGWHGDSYYVDGIKLTGIQLVDDYYYDFGEDGICTDQVKFTGLFEMDGDRYYAISGSLVKNRWIQVDDAWYCFRSDYKAYTGDVTISGRLYHFGETGAITEGQWFDVDGYHRYYIGPNYYSSYLGLIIKEIDGVEYGFDENGDIHRGYYYGIESAGATKKIYRFDENGVRLDVPQEPTIILLEGEYRYIVGGELQSGCGLVQVDGNYYYIGGNGLAATDTHYISEAKSNGFGFVGYYEFDETGKMILKNGIVDGHYYIDGVLQTNKGLTLIDGSYYMIRGNGDLAVGTYYISAEKGNGYGFIGYYEFDETGKLILKNGIVDGHYYIDGVLQTNKGLTLIDGDYYMIRGNGDLAVGTYYITAEKSNGYGFIGYYEFDETGKLLLKNGIVDGHYYIDGVLQTNKGLTLIDGNYYMIRGNGDLAVGTYYITAEKSNGYGFIGYYEFDETGKLLLKNGIVDGHYYINGEMQTNLGLICIDDDYYVVRGNGDLAVGTYYISEARSNGLGFVGYYEFDETGKMIQ